MYQIIRSFVTPSRYLLNFKRSVHVYKILYGTHYDTLKLPRNCTAKEVRDSFIKLSKQCHPDRNRSDPNTHAKFVKLNEAYSILSRPDKRRIYDLTLKPISSERYHRPSESSPFDVYTTAYRQRVVWRDESFWEYKDKNTYGDFSESGDYYGIRGVKRVPNGWIAILCVVFAAVGIWLQVLLIKYSTTFNRHALDERSQETSRVLSDVQEQAQRHGNKMQLELLKQRLDTPQNSSNLTSVTSPEDKNKPSIGNNSPYPYDTANIVVSDKDYYSKPNLGYLGDMPHRIENDITLVPHEKSLTPELHNIPRSKIMENEISPKPILFKTSNTGNAGEQNLDISILSNFSSKEEKETNSDENVSKLIFCNKSESLIKENKGVLTNNVLDELEFLTTSKKLKKNEIGNIGKNLVDVNSPSVLENEKTVMNKSFQIQINMHTSTNINLLSNCSVYALPTEPRFKILDETSSDLQMRYFSDGRLVETSDPIMITSLILLADSTSHDQNLSFNNLR